MSHDNCQRWFPIRPRPDQPLNETFFSNGFVPNDSPPDKVRLRTIAIPFTPVPFVAASSIEAQRLLPIWRVRKHNTFLPIPPPIEVFHYVGVHKLLYHQSAKTLQPVWPFCTHRYAVELHLLFRKKVHLVLTVLGNFRPHFRCFS